jgi:hypothetical protein
VNVAEAVNQVEAIGGSFRLDGAKVRVWYPGHEQRDQLISHVSFLRAHREEAAAFLRARVPAMPPGVRLLAWNLKEPPVAVKVPELLTMRLGQSESTLFIWVPFWSDIGPIS